MEEETKRPVLIQTLSSSGLKTSQKVSRRTMRTSEIVCREVAADIPVVEPAGDSAGGAYFGCRTG
jgi:hypothetical protein